MFVPMLGRPALSPAYRLGRQIREMTAMVNYISGLVFERATITKAEGDREAAINLAAAARTMAESPGAMQLRTLQTIDSLGPTASNTVVIGVPVDLL